MICINVPNVNQGLSEGLRLLRAFGLKQESRVGPVLVMPSPVVTTYQDPTARVLFSQSRNANPFFHLMESLWMLAGRNDIAWPAKFNQRMMMYSDDGLTQHGAYGYRWRQHFRFDQLPLLVDELRGSPNTRRAVLSMWDPQADFNALDGRDVPCNTQAYFDRVDGRLNMTVTCRSNDIWWGCYGANAVHFSILLEYMAAAVGAPVGVHRQFSNNFHAYTDIVPADWDKLADDARQQDLYTYSNGPHNPRSTIPTGAVGHLRRVALVGSSVLDFEECLARFMEDPSNEAGFSHSAFFAAVAVPMYRCWEAYKAKDYPVAMAYAEQIGADDWRLNCEDWLRRRAAERMERDRAKEESNA